MTFVTFEVRCRARLNNQCASPTERFTHPWDYGYPSGSALIVALRSHGWSVMTNPGEDVSLVKSDKALQPFQVFQDLEKATLSAEEWEKTCSELGISSIGL